MVRGGAFLQYMDPSIPHVHAVQMHRDATSKADLLRRYMNTGDNAVSPAGSFQQRPPSGAHNPSGESSGQSYSGSPMMEGRGILLQHQQQQLQQQQAAMAVGTRPWSQQSTGYAPAQAGGSYAERGSPGPMMAPRPMIPVRLQTVQNVMSRPASVASNPGSSLCSDSLWGGRPATVHGAPESLPPASPASSSVRVRLPCLALPSPPPLCECARARGVCKCDLRFEK